MLIAAHAGTGKTTLARKYPNKTIDFVCMPYKYTNCTNNENEAHKADVSYEFNPLWPVNYTVELLNILNPDKIILIPPIFEVLHDVYFNEGIKYILCYPDRRLKDEYRKRYLQRGNTDRFIEIFINGWDLFLDKFENDKIGEHIVLKSGEYLSDVIDLDNI